MSSMSDDSGGTGNQQKEESLAKIKEQYEEWKKSYMATCKHTGGLMSDKVLQKAARSFGRTQLFRIQKFVSTKSMVWDGRICEIFAKHTGFRNKPEWNKVDERKKWWDKVKNHVVEGLNNARSIRGHDMKNALFGKSPCDGDLGWYLFLSTVCSQLK